MIFSDNFLKTKTLTVTVLSGKINLYLPDHKKLEDQTFPRVSQILYSTKSDGKKWPFQNPFTKFKLEKYFISRDTVLIIKRLIFFHVKVTSVMVSDQSENSFIGYGITNAFMTFLSWRLKKMSKFPLSQA